MLEESIPEPDALPVRVADKIRDIFAVDDAIGLLRLGLIDFTASLPDSLAFWQQFSKCFITAACHQGRSVVTPDIPFPSEEITALITEAPFMRGGEYLNLDIAQRLWEKLTITLCQEVAEFDGQLEAYFQSWHAAWHTVGRVCFHLAENKGNTDLPFAFMATYTTGLSASARAQHLPLGRALQEYAEPHKKSQLLALLLPIQKAAEHSPFLKNLIDTSAIFQPQAFAAREAYQFLKDIPHFEAAGVLVRVPNWWTPKRPPRPTIQVAIGEAQTAMVGMNALLDFNMHLTLPDGERLTDAELTEVLAQTDNLVQIKGQWVEVDRDQIGHVLTHWRAIEKHIKKDGLSFAEGLRLLAGVPSRQADRQMAAPVAEWSRVMEGEWLHQALAQLRQPDFKNHENLLAILQQHLNAQLRPYQQLGVKWLWSLYHLKLGGCLADDMGLGKTIQVLSLLLLAKYKNKVSKQFHHLLVLPASLLGNWQAEIQRFAPTLTIAIAHSSASQTAADMSADLVMTTYATLHRLAWLSEVDWDMVILDEAQAIKNPTAKQTRAIKALKSKVRFVLTGTPIENRLLDLWSLFDFVAPGLLGSSRAFADYGKASKQDHGNHGVFYAAVRRLVSPYILRRLKSDKSIIQDLPDKTEINAWCSLSKPQAALYQHAVKELAQKLEKSRDDIQRRGLVLSYLMRLKQICNHPDQWLGHGDYIAASSGKFLRLKELCSIIAEKQEKVLVFSQFREIIPALAATLTNIFGRPGVTLDGQVPIKERSKRVAQFADEQGPPFFVLSLKAGGAGLNLTAASHVIHFDRWWNPAVENQATDRAYRIGQKKNVLVHKFICRGTIEEKVDALLTAKKTLVNDILEQSGETNLTALSNTELLKIVALDIHTALDEK